MLLLSPHLTALHLLSHASTTICVLRKTWPAPQDKLNLLPLPSTLPALLHAAPVKLLLTPSVSRPPRLEITATMYPDGYSYRALTRNPFTGAHGVKIFPASHWNLPRTRPLEAPKPDWAIHAQEGTKLKHMLGLLCEIKR
jgi:hypothetical protein